MSIYATVIAFDALHEPGCPGENQRRTRKGVLLSGECRCGKDAPLVYQGSHILPSDDDPRDGTLLLCQIPGFISRGDRVLCGDDDKCGKPGNVCCDVVWPWLRLTAATSQADVALVLDRSQVAVIHEYLGEWLRHVEVAR